MTRTARALAAFVGREGWLELQEAYQALTVTDSSNVAASRYRANYRSSTHMKPRQSPADYPGRASRGPSATGTSGRVVMLGLAVALCLPIYLLSNQLKVYAPAVPGHDGTLPLIPHRTPRPEGLRARIFGRSSTQQNPRGDVNGGAGKR